MRNIGMVRANPRRWDRASSIVWLARFCSVLVSSRMTTSVTIEPSDSSTMPRTFALSASSSWAFLTSMSCASSSVAAFLSSSSRCLVAMVCSA
ncbi:hypothetical protein [Ornithinimicrobium kibberense]|uniref:hypothetical protein n=1 Tax=Ornithinimicrobium kibberense TaxID=282060 RepID=UPI003608C58D